MTYTDFRIYLDFSENIRLVNCSGEAELTEYAANRDYKTIERLARTTRAALSTVYHIPLRTLEAWASGKATPPQYVLDMLAYCVIVAGRK